MTDSSASVDTLLHRLIEGQKQLRYDLQRYKTEYKTAPSSKLHDNTLFGNTTTSCQNHSQCHNRGHNPISGPDVPQVTRYGALDQRLNESRRTWKTPRKSSGEEKICPGYDWVAGLLDSSQSVSQYSNEWLQELKEFRQVNHSECYMPSSHENIVPVSLRSTECGAIEEEDIEKQAKNYVHSYSIGDRLFPVPINCTCHTRQDEERCPVCVDLLNPQTSHQTPSLVQVSVPQNILQVPYQSRPHRRVSFNPSDSMGLSQHCLSGWRQNSKIASFSNCKNVSLKSSLKQS